MIPAYVAHFGLKATPFSKEISDADLWLPTSKTALVDELCEAMEERTSVVLAELEETRLSMPWHRLTEIDFDLEFGVQLVAPGL